MLSPLRAAVVAAMLPLGLLAPAAVADAAEAPTGSTSVTVLLAAPDPAALRDLARRRHLTGAQRRTRLAPLLPTASTRRHVVARLRAEGFAVTGQDTWAVTATAAARTVTDTLGTPTASGGLSDADTLGSGVDSVITAAAEPDLHPLAATSGADYRNAYAPAGAGASTGANDTAHTVATVQLSGWDSGDLSYYATRVLGVTDPVASGQYTSVAVDGGPSTNSGSGEVDLDQEAILATAPSARQRAYLAPNSLAGFTDAFAAIASEAASRAITAVSVSWGGCEPGWSDDATATMENVLASVNAAGVTVFGATGDDGIYDCGNNSTTASVDYPASSPQVVAVGGTSLASTDGTHTANTGANWTETGWSCTTSRSCASSGGSGGGASAAFARPAWQAGLSGVYGTGSTRLVPDVAAVGDPSTGLTTYLSNGRGTTTGGTSLAAPVAAASFANALGDAGATSHPGDIHSALYAAHQQAAASVFRDVTAGQNGAAADQGSDPSVLAGTGYDTVSGLGAVYWPALLPFLGITTTGTTTAGSTATTGIPTTATPRISGVARTGSRLTAVPGAWTSGTSFTYQWRSLGRVVNTASTWTPSAGYRGHTVQLVVTGHRAGYIATARSSAPTTVGYGVLRSARPVLYGAARVGRTLRLSRGTWTSGTTLSQVWYVGGRATSRATTLRLTRSMRGKRVVVRVVGRRSGYATAVRASAATARVRR